MAITFRSPPAALESALAKLKRDGVVHPDARLNPDAPGGLRREIAPLDRDLLYRAGRWGAEEETVDCALELLKEHGLVGSSAGYDKTAFERHRAVVRRDFEGTWTTLSATMQRLLYMLTSVRRPRNLLELGSFWGFTLAMFAGPCVGEHRAYAADRVIGIDPDAVMTEKARANFGKLQNTREVELLAEDARTALEHIPGTFDFVYLEAKCEAGDGLYLVLLKQLYDRLPRGAWVIAHDSIDWSFGEEMAEYLPYVRDTSRFSESVSFEVDECGLELTIK